MKKMMSLAVVLLMCLTFVLPVFAENSGFVPSITYKPNPEIVPIAGKANMIGLIRDKDGNILDYVDKACLLVTPIAHVWDEEVDVAENIKELLLFVYNALNDGSMVIPYEKHNADLDPANMVIRDLFDVRWLCDEHEEMIEEEGVTFEITFDLGVVSDAEIFVMTFEEETSEWSPIVKAVNNGDGTVTCSFEHLCVVEFSMPIASEPVGADVVATRVDWIWFVALGLAVVAFIIILVAKKKKNAEEK